jgi:hypothetical protein
VIRWAARGALVIVAFDFITALGALTLGYEYGGWPGVVLSTLVIGFFAFMAAAETRAVRVGIAVGALVSLVDATVGWAITWAMGPGAPFLLDAFDQDDLPVYVALTIVSVVAIGALTGLVAALLATRLGRGRGG